MKALNYLDVGGKAKNERGRSNKTCENSGVVGTEPDTREPSSPVHTRPSLSSGSWENDETAARPTTFYTFPMHVDKV